MRTTIAILLLLSLPTSADSLSEAKDHYRRGTQLYDLGKYLEAANEYEAAFKLTDRPAFLFNIGQAYRLGGKPRDALAAYEGFIRRVPEAPQRAEIQQHIDELKKAIADENEKKAADDAAARKAAEEKAAAEKATAEKASAERVSAEKVVVAEHAPPPEKPVYKKWWLWTVVGVVAAGAAVGIAVGVTQSDRTTGYKFPPATAVQQ